MSACGGDAGELEGLGKTWKLGLIRESQQYCLYEEWGLSMCLCTVLLFVLSLSKIIM